MYSQGVNYYRSVAEWLQKPDFQKLVPQGIKVSRRQTPIEYGPL
jgi:hypothetical protein